MKRGYIHIEMDSKPFAVRTLEVDDSEAPKKTLVLMHGFLSASVCFYRILKSLSEKYRLVLFDTMSWGLNTRPEQCSGMASVEASEAW